MERMMTSMTSVDEVMMSAVEEKADLAGEVQSRDADVRPQVHADVPAPSANVVIESVYLSSRGTDVEIVGQR